MASKPYTWSRKPTRTRRAMENASDRMKARVRERARQAAAKLRGHKEYCRTCGRTFRSPGRLAAHIREHARERSAGGRTGPRRARVPVRTGYGRLTDLSTGRRFRNRLEFNDHARRQAERAERAKGRQQERGRRTEAAEARAARGGRPKGTPRRRPARGGDRAQRRAEWHAHRMQHAAGRLDREGNRIPHEPSPRVVRPRERTEPRVR